MRSQQPRLLAALVAVAFTLLACQGGDGENTRDLTQDAEAMATATATAAVTASATATPERPVAIPGTDLTASDRVPTIIRESADEWPLMHRDYANTRAAEARINSGNVDQLEPAWEFVLPGSGPYGAGASAPVIADGVVYFQDLASNVFALDFETGEVLWELRYESAVAGPNGIALGEGMLFAGTGGDRLAGIDLDEGTELWTTKVDSSTFQPSATRDTVHVSTGSHAHVAGHSGWIYALEPETGEERWSLQVVEEGFWGNPRENSGGGVWYTPAIDLNTGTVYYGTGNPGPYPGTVDWPNGTSRPGPNLYTSSLLALGAESGEIEWYYQAVEHDLFDHDFQAPPILATLEPCGEERGIVIGAGKVGRVVALDLATHEVLWDTEVGLHQNDDLDEIPLGEEVTVAPGIFGGVETPMAYADGVIYVPVVNAPTVHTATGHGAADGSSALINAAEHTNLAEATGELVALDVCNGEVLWSAELDSANFGAATVVSDLVFTASYAGTILAFDRETGEEVWRYEAPGRINGWPAVYDDTIVWPIGRAFPPVLLALRLGGAEQS